MYIYINIYNIKSTYIYTHTLYYTIRHAPTVPSLPFRIQQIQNLSSTLADFIAQAPQIHGLHQTTLAALQWRTRKWHRLPRPASDHLLRCGPQSSDSVQLPSN